MGDFNYPQTDWLNWTSSECSDHPSTKFIETIRDNFLFQHISVPDQVTFLNQVTYSDNLVQTELPIERKPNQITVG